MLNQEALIQSLEAIEGKDKTHEQMFAIRKNLRSLSLVALAERYKRTTNKDPYDLKAA